MLVNENGLFDNVLSLLEKDYRGINIAVYALASAGLALSIHKIRPVSKFSKASKVPNHFIRKHVPLRGECAGVQHSPVRVLVDHRAPIYLPLWHSSKPPLPVKLWGVDIVSSNAVNWLNCVAKGRQVTLRPIARHNEDLESAVMLHLPEPLTKTVESFEIGQKLVELGFARAALPQTIKKNTLESQLAPAILSAEARAKSFRNGIWSEELPPIPAPVTYWRKGVKLSKEMSILLTKQLLHLIVFVSKSAFMGTKYLATSAFMGTKYLAMRAFKSSPKQVQTT